jgi:hypothetical protein
MCSISPIGVWPPAQVVFGAAEAAEEAEAAQQAVSSAGSSAAVGLVGLEGAVVERSRAAQQVCMRTESDVEDCLLAGWGWQPSLLRCVVVRIATDGEGTLARSECLAAFAATHPGSLRLAA